MERERATVPPHPVLVTVVAAVAMTAGCTGFGGPFAGGDEAETLTPVSVPSSPEPDPPRSTTPTDPGRGVDATFAPADLVITHSRALRDEPFRLRFTQRIVVNGSTVRNSTYSRRVAADHDAYTATFSRESDGYTVNTTVSDVETYYNGSVLATQYWTSEDSQVRYTYNRNVSVRTS